MRKDVAMRKRNNSILLRLTQEEMDALTQKAKEAKMPRETFCRLVLSGAEIKQAPPADFFALITEVRRVGSNINQVLKKANTVGLIDVPLLRKALEDNQATEDMLWQTFQSG